MPLPAKRLAFLLLAAFVSTGPTAVASAQIAIPRSPNAVRAYFTPRSGANTVLAACSVAQVETDSVWRGYRVRRRIKGIAPTPLTPIGEYCARDRATTASCATAAPRS